MKNIKFLFVLIGFSLLVSCNPDDDNSNPSGTSNFPENFGNQVHRDFIGQIVDINNAPLVNVNVNIGSSTVQTDVNGIFIINDATVYERFAYISAKKTGYIEGSRTLVPNAGKNSVKIMMIPATPIATIASGSTSEVTVSSGTKVVFDGSFEDENGTAYSGNVSVSMYHLESSNENFSKLMPGMLYAETENGNEAALQTFGMLNVELIGSGGQKLQIANGHTAQISMKIDNAQLATAPQTIPLWHFDGAEGYWKEDGFATKQGGFYIGEVSHFSWWNCDAPFPTVSLLVTVVNPDGNPVTNATVALAFSDSTYAVGGYTNAQGQISGLIPSNQTLTMNVYDDCGGLVSTSQIGPFTSNTVLPNIVLSPAVQTVLIQGTLLQCNDANVTNGYVTLNYSGSINYVPVSNGTFSFTQLVCETAQSFTLQGFDFDNLQTTDSISYTYTAPVTNIGNIIACSSVSEFITYQIDNNPTQILIQQVNGGIEGANYFQVNGYNANQNGLTIYGQLTTPGVYTTSTLSIEGNEIYIHSGITNDIVFTITSIGPIGGYIDMTFNGTYTDNGVHTITGTAHVVRSY